MIVTIDGPAGAGKSTIAKRLAARLDFEYLDTGSMYRAIALAGLKSGFNWEKSELLVDVARRCRLELRGERTFLDGVDVTMAVRSPEVTQLTRYAANNPAIRQLIVGYQRWMAADWESRGKSLVTEGRDQGSAVFPKAACRIFLTATPEERARRRIQEMAERGEAGEFDDILAKINRRDADDAAREVGPLVKPVGAVEVVTDGLNIEQVLERLLAIVLLKQKTIS